MKWTVSTSHLTPQLSTHQSYQFAYPVLTMAVTASSALLISFSSRLLSSRMRRIISSTPSSRIFCLHSLFLSEDANNSSPSRVDKEFTIAVMANSTLLTSWSSKGFSLRIRRTTSSTPRSRIFCFKSFLLSEEAKKSNPSRADEALWAGLPSISSIQFGVGDCVSSKIFGIG